MMNDLFADGSIFVDGDVEDEDGSLVCEHGEDGAGVLGPGHVRDLQQQQCNINQ